MDETGDQANAQTHESHDDECQDQRIAHNNLGELGNPSDSLSDERGDSGQNGGDSDSSFLKNQPFIFSFVFSGLWS